MNNGRQLKRKDEVILSVSLLTFTPMLVAPGLLSVWMGLHFRVASAAWMAFWLRQQYCVHIVYLVTLGESPGSSQGQRVALGVCTVSALPHGNRLPGFLLVCGCCREGTALSWWGRCPTVLSLNVRLGSLLKRRSQVRQGGSLPPCGRAETVAEP